MWGWVLPYLQTNTYYIFILLYIYIQYICWRENLPETPIFVAGKTSFPEMLPSISHLDLDRAATKMQLSRNIMTPPFPWRILAVWDRKVVVATAIPLFLLAPYGELISNVISSLPRRSRQLMARWDCDQLIGFTNFRWTSIASPLRFWPPFPSYSVSKCFPHRFRQLDWFKGKS